MTRRLAVLLATLFMAVTATAPIAASTVPYNFGIDTNHQLFFPEKTHPAAPQIFLSSDSWVYAGYTLLLPNLLFSLYPAIHTRDAHAYLSIYKMQFNLFWQSLTLSLNKDTLWFGHGTAFNSLVPQGLDIFHKDKHSWYTRASWTMQTMTVSAALLLDDNIDRYKEPAFLNPFILATMNTETLNLSLSMDYLHHLPSSGKSPALPFKLAGQVHYLFPAYLELYGGAAVLSDLAADIPGHLDAGSTLTFMYPTVTLVPILEFRLQSAPWSWQAAHTYYLEWTPWLSLNTGILYRKDTSTQSVQYTAQLDFFIAEARVKVSYITGNLVQGHSNQLLSIGGRYEL